MLATAILTAHFFYAITEPSVGLDVVAAANTETPLEIQQSGEPNNLHTACIPKQIPAYDNPDRIAGLRKLTKMDSGVQVALPMETCNPFPKDVCVDWFKCTNITLTGVCTQPTLYMLARLSDGTIQIEYNDGDEDSDYPVLSIDYHSITSFEIFKCGRWRSKKLWVYDCRVVVTIPDKMTPKKNKVLTIWMHGPNESVALAKHVLELSICPPLCFIMSTHYDLANPIP
ncbi:hypothetical protein BASA60_009884 [Batrachochytrium salamandrivorans]|nr:hypothetical protein BASA60_009884 [Batrachochytrium salamandrivorans]KAH6575278.1 hypothetical protein BASA62_002020 [Batrachochytrium salamandrivorans]